MNTLKKELPKRFTDAVSKLYNAFHKGELNALDCEHCAVGNMCNNDGGWMEVNSGLNSRPIPKKYEKITGYNIFELNTIETLFMFGVRKARLEISGHFASDGTTESQFKGLCAVIEYLCELDNIPNIMEYKSLFETENNTPKRELSEVFI